MKNINKMDKLSSTLLSQLDLITILVGFGFYVVVGDWFWSLCGGRLWSLCGGWRLIAESMWWVGEEKCTIGQS